MARPLRIDYPGAFHHVMNRGADHQTIFRSDRDRDYFSSLWAESVTRMGIVVLAYAWMGNHYHALVISPDGQLSETLRYIGFRYTQYFNRRHGRDGALFRGRFHSILIDHQNYLDRVARYIERNPLEAGLVTPGELPRYRWSSLHHYLDPREPDWITIQPLLSEVGSRHGYLRYVLSEYDDAELTSFYRQRQSERLVIGDQEFVDSLPETVRKMGPIAGIPSISMEEIDHAILQVRGPWSSESTARVVALQLGRLLARATGRELADRYGYRSTQAVASTIYRRGADEKVAALKDATLTYLGRSGGGLIRRV